ncbi:MAG: flagellar hook capping FlgD N-terminal domain-containing protein [Phycisphaeraceae bacterium]
MLAGAITAAAATAAPAGNRFAELSSDDFIRVMLSELQNQDPFAPSDSAALLEQLSSLRNIESQLSLQKQIESLVLQNQIAQASALIGMLVRGLDDGNDAVEGLVTSVRVQGGRAFLELDTGQTLRADRVTEIREPV